MADSDLRDATDPVDLDLIEDGQEAEPRKKKRFRWGCFLILNFWVALIGLIFLLLFLPVSGEEELEEVLNSNVVEGGGARVEVVAAENIGPPPYFGPGKGSVTRLLITVRVSNLTQIEQALSLNMFFLKDGYGGQYTPHPTHTRYYYEDSEEGRSPWDKQIKPDDSVEAKLVFLPMEPGLERELLVKKGFSWNTTEFVTVAMPQKREPKMQPTTTTLSDVIQTRDKTDLR